MTPGISPNESAERVEEIRRASIVLALEALQRTAPGILMRADCLYLLLTKLPDRSRFADGDEFHGYMLRLMEAGIIYERSGAITERLDELFFGVRPWVIVIMANARARGPKADQGRGPKGDGPEAAA